MFSIRKIIKFFDIAISSILAAFFLVLTGLMLIFSRFKRKTPKKTKNIIQLYISIVDFQQSVISTIKEDILLKGFIKKLFCFHFDFNRKRDEYAYMDNNIYMANISVHPDNALTRAGLTKTVAYFVGIRTFFVMLKTIQKEGVNIIRSHDPHLLGFNAYVLSRLTNVPFIVQICSNYELKDRGVKGLTFRPFMFQALERWFERFIMASSDLVMTDREHYRSFGLIPNDIPNERYANVGFFVNSAHYAPINSRRNIRNDLAIPQNKKILLYVGRLCEVKHTLDLLGMFEHCLKKRKDIMLLIVGSGVFRNEMEKAAKEKGIMEDVLFIQNLPQEKLKDLYYTADVVCFTSAGFTMIEAALAKKCIVAYDYEWHSEFIGENERGRLVPFGDYRKFAEEVLSVLNNVHLCESLGESARSHAIRHYAREGSLEKEIAAYKNVFNNFYKHESLDLSIKKNEENT